MSHSATRVGAIDLGSNTAMLLVLEESGPGADLRPLLERELFPRLGDGLKGTQKLSEKAKSRTLRAVQSLADEANTYGLHTLSLVGTSALRRGDPDGVFLRELRTIVPSARVIDGDTEARLSASGALAVTRVTGDFVCIDVGGGSTEVLLGHKGGAHPYAFSTSFAVSLPLGSVELFDRFQSADEPFLDAYGFARSLLLDTLNAPSTATATAIAGAGSAAAVGAVALLRRQENWHEGARVSSLEVDDTVELLASLSEDDRARVHPWIAERADVAPFGAIVLQAVMHHLQLSEVVVTTAGVRWGLALELLGHH